MTRFDVVVVGAGPAGIAATLAAASEDARVLLIDENTKVGGQLQWRITPTLDQPFGDDQSREPGPHMAAKLSEKLMGLPNVTVKTSTTAWGLFVGNVLAVSSDTENVEVAADRIILATGSTDITYPFPGWTLPGVLTARAVQIFMHVHRVLPGKRWAILGDTSEARELADDIQRCGASVETLLESSANVRATGTNRLSHVEIGDETFDVDGLAIALGRQPDAELAQQAEASVVFNLDLGGFVPRLNENLQTTIPELFVVGDAAGIGTIPELVAEGRLAGLVAVDASAAVIATARSRLDEVSRSARKEARLGTQVTGWIG